MITFQFIIIYLKNYYACKILRIIRVSKFLIVKRNEINYF